MKTTTKIFNGAVLTLDSVSGSDRRIRAVIVANNTPFFLYVSRDGNPTRENALVVVNPYTDVSMPVDVAQNLYVLEGPAIGSIPGNCSALIMWGAETVPLSVRAVGRQVVIPVIDAAALGAAAQSGLTGQSVGGGGTVNPTAATLAIPASARRRTLYGRVPSGASKFTSVSLDGSFDGAGWQQIAAVVTAPVSDFVWPVPDELAIPPYVRVSVALDVYPTPAQVRMVVDL